MNLLNILKITQLNKKDLKKYFLLVIQIKHIFNKGILMKFIE